MNEKINIDLGSVQKTLLFPLWGRARETQKANPLLRDDKAVEIIEKIDYDFSTIDDNIDEMSQLGWVARCIHIDRTIIKFIQKHPLATIVNIGCGMDTTFERVDNGTMQWYDLDMPDTINLRKKFIPESHRRKYLACPMFHTSWLNKINVEDNVLFIASGVLYYFEEDSIKKLFSQIMEKHPESEIIFDATPPFGMKMANKMVVKRGGMGDDSFLKWGLKRAKYLELWDQRIKVLDEYPYFQGLWNKWDLKLSTRMKLLFFDLFKISYLIHLKFEY